MNDSTIQTPTPATVSQPRAVAGHDLVYAYGCPVCGIETLFMPDRPLRAGDLLHCRVENRYLRVTHISPRKVIELVEVHFDRPPHARATAPGAGGALLGAPA